MSRFRLRCHRSSGYMASSNSLLERGKVYFILLKEHVIQRKTKSSFVSKHREIETSVAPPGSLWYLSDDEFSKLAEGKMLKGATFRAVEQQPEFCLLKNEFQNIAKLSHEEFQMLVAVKTCQERALVYRASDGRWLQYACRLYSMRDSIESNPVQLDVADDINLEGWLRYVGPIPGVAGFWFCVEFDKQYTGNLQLSDGFYDDKKLFSCRRGYAVLVSIDKLIPNTSSAVIARHISENNTTSTKKPLSSEAVSELQLNERIAWINSSNKYEFGCVRWIGYLPDVSSTPELMVGVEFDNPVGSGTGTYKGHVLFRAPPNHASLVPANGLIKASNVVEETSAVSDHQHETEIVNQFKTIVGSSEAVEQIVPISVGGGELGTDLEIGSLVEVDLPGQKRCHFGVVRWIGILRDRDKPFVGVELEEETVAGTDGTFGRTRLFSCVSKHAVFVHLHRVSRDHRFSESSHLLNRTTSLAFGSIDCPDICGVVAPVIYAAGFTVDMVVGSNKGIQGHQNSCYMDSMLFSMFAYSMAFDSLLYRPRQQHDIDRYSDIQHVLREGIVNPLRSSSYVRADKVMELRKILNDCSSVGGLVFEEKDPEEFIISLLEQTLKAEHLLKLSSGHECYFHQLFMEKDEMVTLPTTQHLLGMSFYLADLKFSEIPPCLILQMPRFGKDFKMYKRIIPSLRLDITDFLQFGPRPCFNCGQIAVIECKDCFKDMTGSDSTEKQFFCRDCYETYHKHPKRSGHQKSRKIDVDSDFLLYAKYDELYDQSSLPRETMDLFAVVCIHTSHYVAFVKCGNLQDSPWVFFDSMADRIGLSHGYNIPKVELCTELPSFLNEDNLTEILKLNDKELSDHMRRLLCDGYICMYQSNSLQSYR